MNELRVLVALLVVAAASAFAGYAVGNRTDHPDAGSPDVRFLQDMIVHHEQAVQMSKMVLATGEDRIVRSFAEEILYFQAYEIGLMEHQLDSWRRPLPSGDEHAHHDMPGMASDDELDQLSEAFGRDADGRFLRLMVEHHRGGVTMSREVLEQSPSPFVRELAERIARNQASEIVELEAAAERLRVST